jgi:hypothetical protein
MERFVAIPLKSVGPITLGMPRDEVRRLMPQSRKTFRKSDASAYETDSWYDAAFQVFYAGSTPTVEYIELSRSAAFTVDLLGLSVLEGPVTAVLSRIESEAAVDAADPDLGYSYIFPELELSFWRPNTSDDPFSTIGVGCRGYYSNDT